MVIKIEELKLGYLRDIKENTNDIDNGIRELNKGIDKIIELLEDIKIIIEKDENK